jgi:hypothetical protein
MWKWRYSSTILNLGIRWRWVVRFTPQSGSRETFLAPAGNRILAVHPIARLCVYWVIPATIYIYIYIYIYIRNQSQWTRELKHKLLSPVQTLVSWVLTPLEARMRVCEFILCLCCSVCRQRLCDGLIPRPESPIDCVKDQETEKVAKF